MDNFETGKSYRLNLCHISAFLDSAPMNKKIYSVIGTAVFKVVYMDDFDDVMSIEMNGCIYRADGIDSNLGCIFTEEEFEFFELVHNPDDYQATPNFEFDQTKTYAMFAKDGALIQTPTTPSHIMEMLQKMDLTENDICIFEYATTAKSKTIIQFS